MIGFTKMHGLGNDFVVIDGMQAAPPERKLPKLAEALCHRRLGIGADGMILVLPSRVADFRMRIFNPDGSEAEMCGNGIRIFAKFVYEQSHTRARELAVETLAGIVRPRLRVRAGKVARVRVDMGQPRLARAEIPMKGAGREPVVGERIRVAAKRYEITAVSMGNPHCVMFVENVDRARVEQVGPAIETHHLFPRRTNVEFVQIVGDGEMRMRVWERGAGETLACGTGAAAALVAAVLNGFSPRKATVHLLGGDLDVSWSPQDDHVFIEGPAAEVYTGQTRLDEEI